LLREYLAGPLTDRAAASAARSRSSRRARRPALEALETRCVLSFIGSAHLVNPPNSTDDDVSANASSQNGTSVVVWQNAFSSTDHDILAQRYNKTGAKVGSMILVDFTTADSYAPSVAMDAKGRFVVAWFDQSGTSGSTTNVLMRYYNADGTPINSITQVTTSGLDLGPTVAASNGSFVITWSHVFSPADNDVYAERFTSNGAVPVGGGTIPVNIDTNFEDAPSVAMSPSGNFDIAYERQFSGSDFDIYMSQYSSSGSFLRSLGINTDTQQELYPRVAMDNAGNAVVAYQIFVGSDWGVYANRVTSGGSVGSVIDVEDFSGVDETDAAVALAPTGGLYVVSYELNSGSGGFQVTEMSASDSPLATLGPVTGFNAAISIDGFNRYLVTYTYGTVTNGSNLDIYSRRDLLT
jgi:hypothetical protein